MKVKTYIISLAIIFLLVISISSISAYRLLCLGYGDSLPNEDDPIYTCWHDLCQVCTTDNYFPSLPARCKNIRGCEPSGSGGLDSKPPVLMSPLTLRHLISGSLAFVSLNLT